MPRTWPRPVCQTLQGPCEHAESRIDAVPAFATALAQMGLVQHPEHDTLALGESAGIPGQTLN
eukprot:8225236-Lingulodinium_polyedra.AAC.1